MEELEMAQFRLAAANNALTAAQRMGDIERVNQIMEEINAITQKIEQLKAEGL